MKVEDWNLHLAFSTPVGARFRRQYNLPYRTNTGACYVQSGKHLRKLPLSSLTCLRRAQPLIKVRTPYWERL